MQRSLFGTDGIRGRANEGELLPETAFRLGAALAYQNRCGGRHVPRIVVGKDTRLSGYLFETALAAGVCTWGGRVMLTGPIPTPAVAHLTASMRADAGVVISASHNGFEDNGFKVFGADGFKLADEREADLEALMHSAKLDLGRPTGTAIGRASRINDGAGRYIAFVKSTLPDQCKLAGLRVVVDAANGAAYKVAPAVFEELGATVHALGTRPNGRNINAGCGALATERCQQAVVEHGADIGIALDGDADRVIVIDHRGHIVDGDAILALCARSLHRNAQLRGGAIVATVMSNLGLERSIAQQGLALLRCPVGDRYVVETMRKEHCNLGGEQSGHMIFLDHATTGDGLVTALQLIACMLAEARPLAEISAAAFERVPQILLSHRMATRKPIESLRKTSQRIAQIAAALGDEGRVLVRWSGTEPKLRVMVEGPEHSAIEAFASEIMQAAADELGNQAPSTATDSTPPAA